MIYLVSNNELLFQEDIKKLSPEDAIKLISSWKRVQIDSETDGIDAHINKLLCFQFGNPEGDIQIVVDTTTIDIKLFKQILENQPLIGHNLKFDLQFLYNYDIKPLEVFDTMIIEQLLYLGYPKGSVSYSLKSVAERRLGINIDKSIRGEIIWRGLDSNVIKYAAGDVQFLDRIMKSQYEDIKKEEMINAMNLENHFVPVIAYLEWCGIKLDADKWKAKMQKDQKGLEEAKKALDDFCINTESLKKFTYIDPQGDLFADEPFDLTPKCTVNWSSSRQVVEIAKILGFNTSVEDKKTGEDKDSVIEKHLKSQKGINDEFLKLYFNYQEKAKVCSTYGQSQLNMINPNTGRCHTVYWQLGASSGRMSCGSQKPNNDLAKLKGINPKECTYCNHQQLPADEDTRSAFVPENGNVMCDCDFSAMESYLGADIYDDKDFQYEFLYGSKDTHSLFAWMVFRKECEELGCTCVADVKSKAPQWRKAVKAVEFAWMFGAAAPTISQSANCSLKEAEEYIRRLEEGFKGISKFAKEGSKFVRENGYVLMNKYTGHKMYWWDHKEWLERQKSFTPKFWEEYKLYHKGTNDEIARKVKEHFQAASKWDRMARNSVTQGTGACILKLSATMFYHWIIKNNLFNKVKICALIHDEILIEYPKELENVPSILESTMEKASSYYCKFSKIPAEAAVGACWIH